MDSEYGPGRASMPPSSGDHDRRRAPVQTALHDVGAFSRLSCLRPLLTALVVALVLWMGYGVRVWTFRQTASIRFDWDLDNAWSNGSEALRRGRGDFFDGIVEMYRSDEHTGIDYAPLRLYVKTAWVRYVRHRHGPDAVRSDETLYPMLAVNFCFEVLGAIGMYRLCRLFRGPRRSLLAACCLWFNPAVIYNTFGWPQWDIWVVAPVVWATWATLRRGRAVGNVLADSSIRETWCSSTGCDAGPASPGMTDRHAHLHGPQGASCEAGQSLPDVRLLPGDLNGDCIVNDLDPDILQAHSLECNALDCNDL